MVRPQGTHPVLVLGERCHGYHFIEGETEGLGGDGLTTITQLSKWYCKPGLTSGTWSYRYPNPYFR